MSETAYRRTKTVIILLFFAFCLFTCVYLRIQDAPDEDMRYMIPKYIYTHHALPTGTEPELRHSIWGFSYALYPYLSSIISAFFMQLASFVTTNPTVLLLAARFTSVLAGTAFVFIVFKIGELLFKKKESVLLFAVLCSFLPQFLFICSYQNNDSLALFSIALIFYFWLRGHKDGWKISSCIGLGIGCGICALSYYNAYGYILCSIPVFLVSMGILKKRKKEILKKFVLILGIAFLVGGWFFIRNAVIHDGDILGRETIAEQGELYAEDEYKPSQHETPAKLGLSFTETFFHFDFGSGSKEPYSNWIQNTICSFIGVFSFLTLFMDLPVYLIYIVFFFLGFLLFCILGIRKNWWHDKWRRTIMITGFFCILIPLGMSLYNSYYSDFQAQGRYLLPALIPLMMMITSGYDTALDTAAKTSEKTGRNTICLPVIVFILIYMVLFLISYFGYLAPGCLTIFIGS